MFGITRAVRAHARLVRALCTEERTSVQGAYGSRSTRGSGKSLMGSKARGIRKEDKEALARGEHQVACCASDPHHARPTDTPHACPRGLAPC
eukprot:3687673-Prymnesium_polylepis.1